MQAAKGVCDQNTYMNCRLFVQLTSGNPKLESLPVVTRLPFGDFKGNDFEWTPKKHPKIEVGDIIAWGGGDSTSYHWAIYMGGDEILEVPEWGGKMQLGKLDVDETGMERNPPSVAYRPEWV